jgi:plastocyanin
MKKLCVFAVFAILLAACARGEQPAMTGTPPATDTGMGGMGGMGETTAGEETCSPEGTSLSVAAQNNKFDKTCLAAPAGQPFTIAFENKEAVPHNVAILKGHQSSEVLFRGDIFQGPKTVTYQVPALEPGTYVFHCEVHPTQMRGTLVVK